MNTTRVPMDIVFPEGSLPKIGLRYFRRDRGGRSFDIEIVNITCANQHHAEVIWSGSEAAFEVYVTQLNRVYAAHVKQKEDRE